MRTLSVLLAVAVLAAGGAFIYWRSTSSSDAGVKTEARVTDREFKGVRFKRPEEAQRRGIEAEAVRAFQWRPKLHVDGRVLPNPHATLEVRAPFAGVLRTADQGKSFHLGVAVKPQDTLAMLEARFTVSERVDLKTKEVDAKARYQNAEEVLKIRLEKVTRLEKLPGGLLVQDEFDAANVQLSEARMQKNVALTQWNIWKEALESAAKTSIIVPIQSPMQGEIAEITARAGANVDAGQLLARIVDFRQVLLRLDFPQVGDFAPPSSLVVESLGTSARWRALRRGPAPALEVGLQKSSWHYEILPDSSGASPRWQPGLYVRALVEDAAQVAQPAIAIPASSLLVHQGRMLVYLERRVGRYERREVHVLGREDNVIYVAADGWLATEDRVVSKQAQVLLSEEFRSEMDDD